MLIINASPRPKGNCAFLAAALFEKYSADGAELISLSKIKLTPCTACRNCKTNNSFCVIKDDMVQIYPKLISADKIIFISPNHFGFLSSLGKIFTDRWYCLKNTGTINFFEGDKKAVFIFLQGSSSRDKAEMATNWAKHFFTGYGLKYLPLVVSGCTHDNCDIISMKLDEIKMNVGFF